MPERPTFDRLMARPHMYTLDELGNPKAETDTLVWARWFETARDQRRVGWTELPHATVSAVFLGTDHNWAFQGPPVLWETMVFTQHEDGTRTWWDYCQRYTSLAEAQSGHAEAVAHVLAHQERSS